MVLHMVSSGHNELTNEFPKQRTSNVESVSIACHHHEEEINIVAKWCTNKDHMALKWYPPFQNICGSFPKGWLCHMINQKFSKWSNTSIYIVSICSCNGLVAGAGLTHWILGDSLTCLLWTKWLPFCRWHLWMHFYECKVLYLDSNFTEVCSNGSNW